MYTYVASAASLHNTYGDAYIQVARFARLCTELRETPLDRNSHRLLYLDFTHAVGPWLRAGGTRRP